MQGEEVKYRIKISDEYFVSGDYKSYQTTKKIGEASVFNAKDAYGNLAALFDIHNVIGEIVIDVAGTGE